MKLRRMLLMLAMLMGGVDCIAIGMEHMRAYYEQDSPNIELWMYIVPVLLMFSLIGYVISTERGDKGAA